MRFIRTICIDPEQGMLSEKKTHQTLKRKNQKTRKCRGRCRGKRDDSERERNSKGSGTEGQWEGGWLTGTGIGVKEKPDPRSIKGVV